MMNFAQIEKVTSLRKLEVNLNYFCNKWVSYRMRVTQVLKLEALESLRELSLKIVNSRAPSFYIQVQSFPPNLERLSLIDV